MDLDIDFDYSKDPRKELKFSGVFEKYYNDSTKYFTYNVEGSHPETQLELLLKGVIDFNNQYGHLNNYGKYKRTFLPTEYGTIDGKIDVTNNEVTYKVRFFRINF